DRGGALGGHLSARVVVELGAYVVGGKRPVFGAAVDRLALAQRASVLQFDDDFAAVMQREVAVGVVAIIRDGAQPQYRRVAQRGLFQIVQRQPAFAQGR